MINLRSLLLLALVPFSIGSSTSSAQDGTAPATLTAVVGPDSPPTERIAAEELAAQLRFLHKMEVRIATELPASGDAIVLGSPATNPAVARLVGDAWPQLEKQDLLLRSVAANGRSVLILGGGSPPATLWSVYEFCHRSGVRHLLQGDFRSVTPTPLTLTGFSLHLKPAARVRAWQLLDGGAIGTEAWGREELGRLVQQLAKQKTNRIVLAMEPHSPYLHFEFEDWKKSEVQLLAGQSYRVDGDTAGRKAFRNQSRFENPDFANLEIYEEQIAAGRATMQHLTELGHRLGMTVAIRLAPFQLPKGLADRLAATDLERRMAAAEAQLTAVLSAHPDLDAIYLELPSDRALAERATKRWLELTRRMAGSRPLEVNWVVSDAKSDRTAGDGVDSDAGLLIEPRANAKQVAAEAKTPKDRGRIQHVVALADEQVGLLPQMRLGPAEQLVKRSRQTSSDGWVVRTLLPSDSELGAYFLSCAGFDPTASAAGAGQELITTIAGEEISDRLMKGFAMVEQATELMRANAPGFAAAGPEIVRQHGRSLDPPPAWWGDVQTLYTEAMNEMYRGNTRARQGGRGFILYFARRYEFGLSYMASLTAYRQAMIARGEADGAEHVEKFEAAVEGMYNALGALSEVARDPSDRGSIAVLNEFAYRPWLAELQ